MDFYYDVFVDCGRPIQRLTEHAMLQLIFEWKIARVFTKAKKPANEIKFYFLFLCYPLKEL